MATPEYLQTSGDHERLLILVKQVSSDQQLSAPAFDRIFDRIARMTEVRMPDGRGRVRMIKLRYKKTEYSEECNDWGDFQLHRKLLGLVSIGKVMHRVQQDMEEISRNHESTVKTYASTLLDSRCFVLHAPAATAAGSRLQVDPSRNP